uniref:Uncharacterized protein n=1 Tax=Peronospora matthiolae TaxID=2874970 RepID=A0AAV1UU59_9STRA
MVASCQHQRHRGCEQLQRELVDQRSRPLLPQTLESKAVVPNRAMSEV